MKRWFILIVLLLIPFSLALEERLVLRIHQDQNNTIIFLNDYLFPSEEYFVNHTDNIKTNIKNNILTINRTAGGVGTVIVAIKKLLLEKEVAKKTTKRIVNITKIIERYPEIVSYEEKQQTFNTTINYLPFLDKIERQSIEKLHTEILENKLFLSINEEVNIQIIYDNKTDNFDYKLDIQLPQGTLDKKALKFKINKYILTFFILLILAIIIFALYQVYHQFNVFQTKRPKEKIKISKKEEPSSLISKLEKYFINHLNISPTSSQLALEQKLKRKGIKGNRKQEILFLFKKLKEGELSEEEADLTKKYLKRILKGL